jgi:hypothetical protein
MTSARPYWPTRIWLSPNLLGSLPPGAAGTAPDPYLNLSNAAFNLSWIDRHDFSSPAPVL